MFGSSEQSLATNHKLEELREVLIAAKITRQPCWAEFKEYENGEYLQKP